MKYALFRLTGATLRSSMDLPLPNRWSYIRILWMSRHVLIGNVCHRTEGKVKANDKDTVGEISFSTDSNIISITEDSGDIILDQSLDFEDGFH